MLFGAKGRVFQLRQYLTRRAADFADGAVGNLRDFLDANAEAIESDGEGKLVDATLEFVPEELAGQWRRQWVNAFEKGTRQRVPALVDVHNPGLTGGTNNTASGLLAALGTCPGTAGTTGNVFSSSLYVVMNEVSTVATAYALAGFATDAVHISSSGTALQQFQNNRKRHGTRGEAISPQLRLRC